MLEKKYRVAILIYLIAIFFSMLIISMLNDNEIAFIVYFFLSVNIESVILIAYLIYYAVDEIKRK